MGLAVLKALNSGRTQWPHISTILIAGMGFFFIIAMVSNFWGGVLYIFDPSRGNPGNVPDGLYSAVVGVALVGTQIGQLLIGCLANRIGRKKVYGVTLILMAVCSIWSGLSFGAIAKSATITVRLFKLWLGFCNIGRSYSISFTIISAKCPVKHTHGAFIAAVFVMQGVGIIFVGQLSMLLSKIFLKRYSISSSSTLI